MSNPKHDYVGGDFTVDQLHRILGFTMSDEQLAAVTADLERPLLVVAGAGSGKTTVMAARVLWAVGTGQVKPDEVVGLTFTRKAAGELGARIRHLLDVLMQDYPPRSAPEYQTASPLVSTYHAFAHQFVSEHGLRIGVEPGARLLSETESLQIAYRVLLDTQYPLTEMTVAAPTLAEVVVKLDQQLAEHITTPAQLRAHEASLIEQIAGLSKPVEADRKLRDVCAQRLQLCEVVEEFRAEKTRHMVVDFADVLRLGHELAARSDVQAIFHERVAMVLLDEYQDTSIVQAELLAPLIGETGSVTAVGDPLQAIYGWRGAGANAMADFATHFGGDHCDAKRSVNVLPLSISQRSGPTVLAVANDIAAPLRGDVADVVTLRPGTDDDGNVLRDGVRAAAFETYREEVRWLGDRIAEQIDAGTPLSRVAVLCRAKSDFPAVLDELRGRNIPAVISGSEGLLAQPEVADVIGMLEVVNDPTSNPAMLRLLMGPRFRIGPRDLALLGRRAAELSQRDSLPKRQPSTALDVDFTESIRGIDRADLISLAEAVDDLGVNGEVPFSAQARGRITQLSEELAEVRKARTLPLADLVSRVISIMGLDVEARLCAMTAELAQETTAQRSVAAIQALHELVNTAQGSADSRSLAGFLAWVSVIQRVKREPEFDVPVPADAVAIMTVHKSKGLEWDVVAVPFLSESVFPSGRSPDRWTSNIRQLPYQLRGDRDSLPDLTGFGSSAHKTFGLELAKLSQAEERRLGYVAVTRPTRLLIASGHWWGPTQIRKRGPSSLLEAVRSQISEPVDTDPWIYETSHSENPQTADEVPVNWPRDLATPSRERRVIAAGLVEEALRARAGRSLDQGAGGGAQLARRTTSACRRQARGGQRSPAVMSAPASPADLSARALNGHIAPDGSLTEQERATVEDWDRDIELLLAERHERLAPNRVPLPNTLSASDFVAVKKDSAGFLARRSRPMPQKPSPAAARGTRFHTWVEEYLGSRPMFEELPGAIDDELFTEEELVELRRGFMESEYADLTPYALEVPFSIVVGGLVLKGRIDAVYQRGERWEVVDWKTNQRQTADPLQLAVYRYAWSQMLGVADSDVDGVFVYVRTSDVVRFTDLPDIPEMIAGGLR